MCVLLIVLLVVFLIAMIRVRLVVEYDGDGFRGFVAIYPIKLLRFPKKRKHKKSEKQLKETKVTQGEKKEKSYGSLKELTWLLEPVFKTLGKLSSMITVKVIEAEVRLSSENAASTALLYGSASVGIGAILPILDRTLKIKRKKIFVTPDFQASESVISLYANAYIRVWKLVIIAVFLLCQIVSKKRKIDKKKGIEKNG